MTKHGHKERKDVSLRKSRTVFEKNNPDLDYDDHHDEDGNRLFDKVCEMCDGNYRTKNVSSRFCCLDCKKKNDISFGKYFPISKDELEYVLYEKEYSIKDIEEHFGCKKSTIYSLLKEYNLPSPSVIRKEKSK